MGNPGFLMHLAAPFQSYGTNSAFNNRDTATHPTRSALIGMMAAAFGYPRGHELTRFSAARFTVRIDRPGIVTTDFHTIGGGRPPELTPKTAVGGRRPERGGTIVTERDYLSDAAFTVAVTNPDPQWSHQALAALRNPHWAPHLGRRSCPANALLCPTGVLTDADDALTRFPLHRRPPESDDVTAVPIEFVAEQPPSDNVAFRTVALNDDPAEFWPSRPGHGSRTAWVYTLDLGAELCAGLGNLYLRSVADTTLEAAS